MTDEFNQVRRTDDSWGADTKQIAETLEGFGVAYIGYAAEGSLHEITVLDGRMIEARRFGCGPRRIAGPNDFGRFALWTITSWSNRSSWLPIAVMHDADWVQAYMVKNPIDAVAVTILMNAVEYERALLHGYEWELKPEELEKRWLGSHAINGELARKLGYG